MIFMRTMTKNHGRSAICAMGAENSVMVVRVEWDSRLEHKDKGSVFRSHAALQAYTTGNMKYGMPKRRKA